MQIVASVFNATATADCKARALADLGTTATVEAEGKIIVAEVRGVGPAFVFGESPFAARLRSKIPDFEFRSIAKRCPKFNRSLINFDVVFRMRDQVSRLRVPLESTLC